MQKNINKMKNGILNIQNTFNICQFTKWAEGGLKSKNLAPFGF